MENKHERKDREKRVKEEEEGRREEKIREKVMKCFGMKEKTERNKMKQRNKSKQRGRKWMREYSRKEG